MRAPSRRPEAPRPAAGAWPWLLALTAAASQGCAAGQDAGAFPVARAPAPPAPTSTAGRPCGAPRNVGRVADTQVQETSGLAASPRRDDLFYLHNDSGDAARLFAIDGTGQTVAEIRLEGVSAFDWEGLAIGPDDQGAVALYVGDLGDNHHERPSVTVYRFPEPDLGPDSPRRGHVPRDRIEALELVYPNGEHPDAEALLVDGRRRELLVITKERRRAPRVFVAQGPLAGDPRPRALSLAGTVRLPLDASSRLLTDAALSPAGDAVLVRTYDDAFLFVRRGDEPLSETLGREPVAVPAAVERQGEAIAFTRDGGAYLTISEGEHPTIWRVDLCPAAD